MPSEFCSRCAASRYIFDHDLNLFLQATKAVTERYDALSSLFEDILYFLQRLKGRWLHPSAVGDAVRCALKAIFIHIIHILSIAINFMKDEEEPRRGFDGRVEGTWKRFKRTFSMYH